MRQVAPEDSETWQTEAMKANADNLPIDLNMNFTAAGAREKVAQPQAPAQPAAPASGTSWETIPGNEPPEEETPEVGAPRPPAEPPRPGKSWETIPGNEPPEEPGIGEIDTRTPAAKASAEQLPLPGIEEPFKPNKPPPDEPPGGGGGVPRDKCA